MLHSSECFTLESGTAIVERVGEAHGRKAAVTGSYRGGLRVEFTVWDF